MKQLLFVSLFLLCSPLLPAQSLSRIQVEGNSFVTESGETFIFHGMNIADPDKLESQRRWRKSLFKEVKAWGANAIRLPVHPRAWRTRGEKGYLKLLDEAVTWANELGLYLIIDWHSIGNLRTELYQDDYYNTTQQETFYFWKTVASRYKDEPAVALYEVFNEPTTISNRLGSLSWSQWKSIQMDIITIIQANNPQAVVLVAGLNWAYDLRPAADEPFSIQNLAYVSHPYPQKREAPWEDKWQEDFGFVSEFAPVILTEIGFALPNEPGVHIPVYGDETYGQAIVDFAAERGISWVGWVFDPEWSPMMIKDWDYTPTRQGAFFKKVLQATLDE